MAEVRVIARAVARAGKEDELRVLLQDMIAPTHREPGCLLYELYESHREGRFYFHESWENAAALDDHVTTPHFQHLQQEIGELLAEPFEVNILKEVPVSAAA
jgi:quinol monooxygenase YgiN